jgi:hypothetical protein
VTQPPARLIRSATSEGDLLPRMRLTTSRLMSQQRSNKMAGPLPATPKRTRNAPRGDSCFAVRLDVAKLNLILSSDCSHRYRQFEFASLRQRVLISEDIPFKTHCAKDPMLIWSSSVAASAGLSCLLTLLSLPDPE